METLSPAELHIIRSMLVKQYGPQSPFLEQLATARVETRRITEVGVFIDLAIAEKAAGLDEINEEISVGYQTLLAPPRDLVGFTLFIREGYLNFLEGYTFANAKWPEEAIEKWIIFDQDSPL
jgi:hypothetical protein